MNLNQARKRFTSIALGMDLKVNEVVRTVALRALQIVVTQTPVDTGHARANWQVGINAPVTKVIPAEDKGGSYTIGEGRSRIVTRLPGQTVYLSNNVPYIQRLNEGWSAQAPAGFVEDAVALAARSIPGASIIK